MIENGYIHEERGVKLVFVVPETAPETVYCRAEIGSTEGLDLDGVTREMLSANLFWRGANGATLGLHEDVAYLTDRRERAYFGPNDEELAEYEQQMVLTVLSWRERLENHRLSEEVR